jgi:hypothetical protein
VTLIYTTRPISDRHAFGGERVFSQFMVTWTTVLDLLEREYDFLDGERLVIEVDVREDQIRNDGMIRSGAAASSPGARIAFESKFGPIIMATDRFVHRPYGSKMQQDWQHNVYAIALSLEALRKVDRYGVTKRGEQYTGWKAIGGAPEPPSPLEAIGVLAAILNASHSDVNADLPRAIRRAKALAHPDRNNGHRVQWDQVEEAARVLEATRDDS